MQAIADSLPGDKRFFERKGPFTLGQLAEVAGAKIFPVEAEDRLEKNYAGIAPLQIAGANDVSFLDNRRYAPLLKATQAGCVIVGPAFTDQVPSGTVALVTSQPYVAWARIANLFFPPPPVQPGIHSTAVIDPSATIEAGVAIGPYAFIGKNAVVGAYSSIGSHVVIEEGVVIGNRCVISHHVTISHTLMGNGIKVFPGARIGQDGFGFAMGEEGFITVPQLGRVIIEDAVEIGANTTIDRGSVTDTIIGAGSRLDNLVQIGHNVKMGKCCIVVSQAGISGSTELEDFVTIAAQAGLIGHIKIGKKARVGAQCGVMSDVEAGAEVIGSPAMPFKEFFRNVAALRKFAKKPSAER